VQPAVADQVVPPGEDAAALLADVGLPRPRTFSPSLPRSTSFRPLLLTGFVPPGLLALRLHPDLLLLLLLARAPHTCGDNRGGVTGTAVASPASSWPGPSSWS